MASPCLRWRTVKVLLSKPVPTHDVKFSVAQEWRLQEQACGRPTVTVTTVVTVLQTGHGSTGKTSQSGGRRKRGRGRDKR